jgi:hypothetical protein
MSSPALRGSAEWSARRELALLLGLTRGNHYAAQELWLRKESIKAEASQGASAGAPQASQQPAGCQAKPATVEARGVPKPKTAAQLARSERGRERLRRKHLARVAKVAPKLQAWLRRARANLERRGAPAPPATPTGPSVAVPEGRAQAEDRLRLPAGNLASKVWASVRVATRLLAWRVRVRARAFSAWSSALDHYVERAASLGTRKAVRVTEISNHSRAGPFGAPLRAVVALPILVGRLLVQQWPSNRQRPRRPRRRAAPPPATQLAALAPPSQQPTLALAAAARATLDPSELQESRGSKREALARPPPSAPPPERPPPAESRKKTRGTGALQAALAAAAPAAAAPQPPTATSPLAPALLADANPFRLLA